LREDGHRVEVVDLPSSGTVAAELGDLQAEIAAVRRTVDGIGAEVVLVAHSGGGMVLTEFADHPSVQHSVYLAALWPQKGQSATDLLGGQLPGWVAARDDGTIAVSSDLEVVRQTLCADIDAERFAKQVYPRYELMSLSSLASPSTAPVPPAPHDLHHLRTGPGHPPASPGSDGRRRRPRHPAAVLTLALPVHAQAAGNNPRRRRQLNLTRTCAVSMITVQLACN